MIEELGLIYGRDAIYLNNIEFTDNNIMLKGEFNGELCENIKHEKDVNFELIFKDIIHFEKTELDFYNNHGKYSSSFEEFRYSKKIKEFKKLENSKLKENHTHYVFYTYDCVFEFVATSYKIKLLSIL